MTTPEHVRGVYREDRQFRMSPRMERVLAGIADNQPEWMIADALGTGTADVRAVTAALKELTGSRRRVELVRVAVNLGLVPHAASKQRPTEVRLSLREAQVLEFVLDGQADKQIATTLGISLRSVQTYLDRIGSKTGCRTRAELMRLVPPGRMERPGTGTSVRTLKL